MCKGITFGLKVTVPISYNFCLVGDKNQTMTAQMVPPAVIPARARQRRGPVFKALMPPLIM